MGKFGSSTTALQALQGLDLTGKTAIVTGGNSGIGVETVRALAHAGAKVILTSRKVEAGQKVADSIKQSGVKGNICVKRLDLSDLANVRAFAKDVSSEPNIDLLLLNAGVMGTPLEHTAQGFELQIGTNHFGHFELVNCLLGKLRAQGTPVRIVVLSSSAHKWGKIDLEDLHYKHRPYTRFGSYGQSKLANVLFARELARRLDMENLPIKVFSVHPGVIRTSLSRHLGPFVPVAFFFLAPFFKTPAQGAATTVYAAVTPELESHSGEYLVDCQITPTSKEGQDMEMAAKLWKVTEEQIAAAMK